MLWHALWHDHNGLLGSLSEIRSHKGVFVLTPHLHNFFVLSPSRLSSKLLLHLISKFLWNIFKRLSIKCPSLRAQHSVDCIFIGIFNFTQPNRSRNRKMPLDDWNDIENLHKSVLTGVQILNFKRFISRTLQGCFVHRRLDFIWNRELQHSLWSMTFKCFVLNSWDFFLKMIFNFIARTFQHSSQLSAVSIGISAVQTILILDDCLISKQIDRDSEGFLSVLIALYAK